MFTVVRTYTGAPNLAEELKKRSKDVESEISTVPGFIAYYLVRTPDGVAAVTICDSRDGCDESTRRAANWLRHNLPTLRLHTPQVISGEVALRFANDPAKV